MSNTAAGIEASGVSLLKRAVELDQLGRYAESVVCYQEGIQLLMDLLKITTDTARRDHLRQKIKDYMDRAEKLKAAVEKEKEDGKYHEQIHIENNSTGHSYETLFARFLDESLTYVEVEDPYIRSIHQVYNFLRFCELLVKHKCPVKRIKLTTGMEENNEAQRLQISRIDEISHSLGQHGVQLEVEYSGTLHDREIRFDNGWIIKIGRGLDIYKATQGKFSLGFCDFDLRTCHETTVDIFHKKHTKPGKDT